MGNRMETWNPSRAVARPLFVSLHLASAAAVCAVLQSGAGVFFEACQPDSVRLRFEMLRVIVKTTAGLSLPG